MQLSRRLTALPRSGTLAIGEQVRTLRQAGHTVFNLSGGAPDPCFPGAATPPAIAPAENTLGNSWGEPVLRDAFAARLAKYHGVVRRADREMVVTIGAKQALYFALLAILEADDQVIIIDPCWVTYAPAVELAGAHAVAVPLEPRTNRLDVEAIAAAITPRTRAIIINTPHNPTGRVFSEPELSGLVDLVRQRELWLICDESFDLFVFDDNRHLSPGTFETIRDRTILLYSFSKAFAMPSYRIGMLVGPEPVCRLIANCSQQLISSVSLASQKMAHQALLQEAEWQPALRRAYQEKRDTCLAVLERDGRFDLHPPQGTFYLFPNIERTGCTGTRLADHLLKNAGVAVTPGAAFGAAGENHIRLNLVGSLDAILAGTKAMLEGMPH